MDITTKLCDICRTANKVHGYKVQLVANRAPSQELPDPIVMERKVDLCDRYLERLKKFIKRGCTPPPGQDVPADDDKVMIYTED